MTIRLPTEQHLQQLKADKFGYEDLSKRLLDDILLNMELPNCFGVYGNWGSGKSTILHFMQEHLKERKEIKFVSFEPWKYEYAGESDLLFALLQQIKKTLNVSTKRWKTGMAGLLTVGAWGMENASRLLQPVLGFEAGMNVNVSDIKRNFQEFEAMLREEHETWVDRTEALRGSFASIVNEYLDENGKLVVFIDDLDRCLPENAVRLLETVKNYLSVPRALFVIAIDRRVVSEMVQKKYGLHDGFGDEYLMKIIQYYFELPKVTIAEIVEEVLKIYSIPASNAEMNYMTDFLRRFAPEPRKAKHFLHQFGLRYTLGGRELQDYARSQPTEGGLQNTSHVVDMFVVVFMACVCPRLFATGDVQHRFGLLRECVNTEGQGTRYEPAISRTTFVSEQDRKILEQVIRSGFNKNARSFCVFEPQQFASAYKRLERYL